MSRRQRVKAVALMTLAMGLWLVAGVRGQTVLAGDRGQLRMSVGVTESGVYLQ